MTKAAKARKWVPPMAPQRSAVVGAYESELTKQQLALGSNGTYEPRLT